MKGPSQSLSPLPPLLRLRGSRGFSLVEILVVVAILGALTGFALLGLRSAGQTTASDIAYLHSLLRETCDEALFGGYVAGVRITHRGVDGWRWDDGWKPLSQRGLSQRDLSQRDLSEPDPHRWRNARPLALMVSEPGPPSPRSAADPLDPRRESPQILCDTDGRLADFELQLDGGDGGTVRLYSDLAGRLVQRP